MKKFVYIFLLFMVQSVLKGQIAPFSIDSSFQSSIDFSDLYDGGKINDIFELNNKLYLTGTFYHFANGIHYRGHISLFHNGDFNNQFRGDFGNRSTTFFPINDTTFISCNGRSVWRVDTFGNSSNLNWFLNRKKTVRCGTTDYPYFFKDGSSLLSNPQGNNGGCGIISGQDTFPHRYIVKLDPQGNWDSTYTKDADSYPPLGFLAYDSNRLLVYGSTIYFKFYDNQAIDGLARIALDGEVDTTFKSPLSTVYANSYFRPIQVESDGSFFIIGRFLLAGDTSRFYHVVKLHSDGSIDSTFNFQNGIRDTSDIFGGGGYAMHVFTIAPTTDGGYLIGGDFRNYQGYTKIDIVKTDAFGNIEPQYFTGVGPDSSRAWPSLQIHAYVNKIIPSAQGGYYVVGNFLKWDGQRSQPIIRLHDITVGLNEVNNKNAPLIVFPNPTSNSFSFTIPNLKEEQINIKLYNSKGQEVYNLDTRHQQNKYNSIHIENFTQGIYYLKVQTNNQFYYSKILKQ